MEYKSVKGFTGWAQLGFLFAFLGLGVVLAFSVQPLFDHFLKTPLNADLSNKDTILKAMLAPENVTLVRLNQTVGTLFLLFLPALLWSVTSYGKNMFWLGFNKYINIVQLTVAVLIMFSAALASGPFEDLTKAIVAHFPSLDVWAKKLEEEYIQQANALSNLRGWGDYITAIFIMAFFPAMFEEVFFRGALQNLLTKWLRKPVVAITISSLIFSLIHMSVYLFLSRFLLGFALGWMFYETKNIWVNILAHFVNNAVVLSVLFFSPKDSKTKAAVADPHVHWILGIFAAAVTIGLLIFLKKSSALNKARIDAKENLLIAEADPFRSFADTQTN